MAMAVEEENTGVGLAGIEDTKKKEKDPQDQDGRKCRSQGERLGKPETGQLTVQFAGGSSETEWFNWAGVGGLGTTEWANPPVVTVRQHEGARLGWVWAGRTDVDRGAGGSPISLKALPGCQFLRQTNWGRLAEGRKTRLHTVSGPWEIKSPNLKHASKGSRRTETA